MKKMRWIAMLSAMLCASFAAGLFSGCAGDAAKKNDASSGSEDNAGVTSATLENKDSGSSDVSSGAEDSSVVPVDAGSAYTAFLKGLYGSDGYERISYCCRNMGGNVTDELIVVNFGTGKLTVYSFDGEVKEIGAFEGAVTGSNKLQFSDYPWYDGIFICSIADGVESHDYIGMQDGVLKREALWTYDPSEETSESKGVRKISDDQEKLNASQNAYKNEYGTNDIPLSRAASIYGMEANKAYDAILQDGYENNTISSFCRKDLDDDGLAELLTMKNTRLTVYRYDGESVKSENHDFETGTIRLLESGDPAYPGILCFTVDSGREWYRYMSLRGGKLSSEDLWTNNYAVPDEMKEDLGETTRLTDDEQLIGLSKTAYEKNKDVAFLSVDTLSARGAYTAFLKDLSESDDVRRYFCFKDLNGDGVEELLTRTPATREITAYGYDGKVTELGSLPILVGSTRLANSGDPSYPGILNFNVGGGRECYFYITVKDGKLVRESLWADNYAYAEIGDPERITEISEDRELIELSKTLFDSQKEVEFLPIETLLQ